MTQSVIIPRTHRWRHFRLRHQIAMQDTSSLARANHLPVRNIFRKIVNAFGGYRFRSSQHGFCRCQNLITECRTQHQGQILKTVSVCISQICCEPLQQVHYRLKCHILYIKYFELFLKAGRLYSALILSMSFGSTSQSKLRNRHVSLLVVITFLNPYCGREMLFCYVLLIK